jgi:hypothetical protein
LANKSRRFNALNHVIKSIANQNGSIQIVQYHGHCGKGSAPVLRVEDALQGLVQSRSAQGVDRASTANCFGAAYRSQKRRKGQGTQSHAGRSHFHSI